MEQSFLRTDISNAVTKFLAFYKSKGSLQQPTTGLRLEPDEPLHTVPTIYLQHLILSSHLHPVLPSDFFLSSIPKNLYALNVLVKSKYHEAPHMWLYSCYILSLRSKNETVPSVAVITHKPTINFLRLPAIVLQSSMIACKSVANIWRECTLCIV